MYPDDVPYVPYVPYVLVPLPARGKPKRRPLQALSKKYSLRYSRPRKSLA